MVRSRFATFFAVWEASDSVVFVTTSTAQALPIPSSPSTAPLRAPAPIIKWVGGKGRLMSQLRPLLPPGVDLMRHVEPFVGGGAMFFERRPERAMLCDINPQLVNVYTQVRDDVDGVIGHLRKLAAGHSKEHYYEVRTSYNAPAKPAAPQRAAMFIYLNKTCFNGLHRVNRKGEFNVPAGRYDKPRILDEDLLRSASHQLAGTDIRCTGFESLLSTAKPGDFIYLDPPYEPVSRTASFTAYAQDGFAQADQTRLRDVFSALHKRRCRLMLSNSDVPFIRELYGKFKINVVAAGRAINSNASKRGPVPEVVVRNY